MHCFLCGVKKADEESLKKYDVPICEHCVGKSNAKFYRKNNKVIFHNKYIISPPINSIEEKECSLCNKQYETDVLFDDFGFDKNICPICLKNKDINIQLSNTSLQPVWRKKN